MRYSYFNVWHLLRLEQPRRVLLLWFSDLLVSRMEVVGGELGEGREGGAGEEGRNVSEVEGGKQSSGFLCCIYQA